MYQIRISLYLEAIALESKFFARLLKALTNSALLTQVNQQAQPTYDVTCRIRAQAPLSSPKLNACVGGYIGRRQLAALAHRRLPPPPLLPTPLRLTLLSDNVTYVTKY